MIRILQMTPIWVFFLFFFLAFMGYQQSKARLVSRARLAVLPIAMISLSLYSVWGAFGPSLLGFSVWALAAALAVLFNVSVLKQPRGVTFDAASGHFQLPGSWVPFWLMMVIFVAKYFVNASLAMHIFSPELPAFIVGASVVFGLLVGTFFARAIHTTKSGAAHALVLSRAT